MASAGTYSCTVTCPCGSLSTPSLALTSLAAPVAPVGTGTTILGPGAANISATGTDVHWFNAATNGAEVGAGNNFTTPLISSTTSYWAEARNTAAGQNLTVGRAANTIQGSYSSTKQWLTFDANVPFKLQSFKVQANSTGQRHFVMVDRLGNLIAEKYIEIPAGLNTITVNWDVPAGVQHKISAFDDNTEVVRDLWINTSGVAYPYPIGTLGAITGSTGGSSTYYYLYDWVVTTPSVVAASARTQVTATVTIVVTVAPKVFLEGPYDNVSGLMRDDLRVAGLVPLTEPYTALGYAQVSGGGGETTTTGMLATTGNTAVVDWILLELRNSVTPSTIVATRCGLLLRNGSIIAADGSSIRFVASAGNYFVSVRHRNHLGCMIAAATSLNTTTTPIDFSNSATSTWGSSARKQIGSTMVLWAGQTTVDGVVKYTGTNNDRDPILLDIGGAIPTNTVNGYMGTDVNLDGVVKYTGIANDRDPILINIGGAIPTNTLIEQLP